MNSSFLSAPARKRLVQTPRSMLQELRTTIEYGNTIWEYLCTATYNRTIACTLSELLSIAESNIITIAKSIIIHQQLTNKVQSHSLSPLFDFYSSPVPKYKAASPSLRQQIQDIRVRDSTPKPFYWNNYFAPLFQFFIMSDDQLSATSTDMNGDEVSTGTCETVVSTSKSSRVRGTTHTVADLSVAKISKIVKKTARCTTIGLLYFADAMHPHILHLC